MDKQRKFTEKEYEVLGLNVIEILELKMKKNGRVDTTWGDKTPLGLGKVIERLVSETK